MENLLTEFGTILAEARSRGCGFEFAWRRAMKVLRVDKDMTQEQRADVRDWRVALQWSKPFFESAYNARAGAQPSHSDALRDAQSVGNRSRDSALTQAS